MEEYNIYCDESCHLEHDNINVMVLGAIWCPRNAIKDINGYIRKIKVKNDLSSSVEMKWTKISPAKLQVYIDIVNYFFVEERLHFRAVVIPDKKKLDHIRFNQTHDDWYYKMYYEMLKQILSPKDCYSIYIDVKDTHTGTKAQMLREVCCNSVYDFNKTIIKKIQPIRSDEVEIMQIVDILIGALAYVNRIFANNHVQSSAKLSLIKFIKERSNYSLDKNTPLRENKMNLFFWDAR